MTYTRGFIVYLNSPVATVIMQATYLTIGPALYLMLYKHHQMQGHLDGLVQERYNSIGLELELRLSCINPSICKHSDGQIIMWIASPKRLTLKELGYCFQNQFCFLMLFMLEAIFWYNTGPIPCIFQQHCGYKWPGALGQGINSGSNDYSAMWLQLFRG